MANYAIHDGTTVVNVIIADDEATAEAVTGLDVIPVSDDGVPGVGWTMEDEGWRPPSPFPSWEWQGDSWLPPIPYPQDGAVYAWNEEQGDWIEQIAPEPEPEPVTE